MNVVVIPDNDLKSLIHNHEILSIVVIFGMVEHQPLLILQSSNECATAMDDLQKFFN